MNIFKDARTNSVKYYFYATRVMFVAPSTRKLVFAMIEKQLRKIHPSSPQPADFHEMCHAEYRYGSALRSIFTDLLSCKARL